MEAFDHLPPPIRAALRDNPFGVSARLILRRYQRGHDEARLLAFLETCNRIARREIDLRLDWGRR